MKRIMSLALFTLVTTNAHSTQIARDYNVVDDYNWTATFIMESGIEITHRPTSLSFHSSERDLTIPFHNFYENETGIFNFLPKSSGKLSAEMSQSTFEKELAKLGEVRAKIILGLSR